MSFPLPPSIASAALEGKLPAGSRVTVAETSVGVIVSFAAVPVNVAIFFSCLIGSALVLILIRAELVSLHEGHPNPSASRS
jgi:hypothetical protein